MTSAHLTESVYNLRLQKNSFKVARRAHTRRIWCLHWQRSQYPIRTGLRLSMMRINLGYHNALWLPLEHCLICLMTAPRAEDMTLVTHNRRVSEKCFGPSPEFYPCAYAVLTEHYITTGGGCSLGFRISPFASRRIKMFKSSVFWSLVAAVPFVAAQGAIYTQCGGIGWSPFKSAFLCHDTCTDPLIVQKAQLLVSLDLLVHTRTTTTHSVCMSKTCDFGCVD